MTERACAQCRQPCVVLLAMDPGYGGVPWWLCPRCWSGKGRAPQLQRKDVR